MYTQKADTKKKILEAGLKQHQLVIDDFRQRIKELTTDPGNKEEYDSPPQSFKSETIAEVSLLTDQLQFANHESDELSRLDFYAYIPHPKVEFGTVVKTNKDTFFVSAGIERFYAEGKPIFGMSVLSPIYRAMKGKKVGDSFECAGKTYEIEEIL